MHQKAMACAWLGLFAVACGAAPGEEAREQIGTVASEIRDPTIPPMCTDESCDTEHDPDDDGLGGLGGGGWTSGGGGTGPGGEGGEFEEVASLLECRQACMGAATAGAGICMRVPLPARLECSTVMLVGGVACFNFCAWHFS